MARRALTDEEILAQVPAARQRARAAAQVEPRATRASLEPESGRIAVELKNGCAILLPPSWVPGLEHASNEQLAAVEVEPGGETLRWEELNADVSLPGLVAEILNVGAWAAKYLGSRTSPAKAEAARINGLKGGRPRSTTEKASSRRKTAIDLDALSTAEGGASPRGAPAVNSEILQRAAEDHLLRDVLRQEAAELATQSARATEDRARGGPVDRERGGEAR